MIYRQVSLFVEPTNTQYTNIKVHSNILAAKDLFRITQIAEIYILHTNIYAHGLCIVRLCSGLVVNDSAGWYIRIIKTETLLLTVNKNIYTFLFIYFKFIWMFS